MEQGPHAPVRQRSEAVVMRTAITSEGVTRDTYRPAPSDAAGSRHHQRPDGAADGTASGGTTRTAPTGGDARARWEGAARARGEGAPAHLRVLLRAGRSSDSGSLPPSTGAVSHGCDWPLVLLCHFLFVCVGRKHAAAANLASGATRATVGKTPQRAESRPGHGPGRRCAHVPGEAFSRAVERFAEQHVFRPELLKVTKF